MTSAVEHKSVNIDGTAVFYREAGPADAPVLLLPHGYPCSSYEFRNFIPALADRWRLIAPDFPGCGYSETPEDFDYSFDGFQRVLSRFVEQLGVQQYALYLHDFGSQIGLRLAIAAPERVTALIVQNGDIYEDVLGPKYQGLKDHWSNPTDETRAVIEAAVSEEGYREEFLNDVSPEVAKRIPPDLWKLHWSLTTPQRKAIHERIIIDLKDNLRWFPRYQEYLRKFQPTTLIVWGPCDGYMPAESARAYLRDLPNAELHILEDAGHWLLETHLEKATRICRDFLERVLTARQPTSSFMLNP
jgi:pimeloyl-ACP methyl ester carboxylesterase